MPKKIVFIDTEIGIEDRKIHDIGAIRSDKTVFHSSSLHDFYNFISDSEFVCGHNIIHHDLKYLPLNSHQANKYKPIDTLYLSPLLFPKRPYHSLLKNDKIITEELNNPVNDSIKAANLFYDEVSAFHALSKQMQQILDKMGMTKFFGEIAINPEMLYIKAISDNVKISSDNFS